MNINNLRQGVLGKSYNVLVNIKTQSLVMQKFSNKDGLHREKKKRYSIDMMKNILNIFKKSSFYYFQW